MPPNDIPYYRPQCCRFLKVRFDGFVVEGGLFGNEYSIGKPISTRHEQTILSAPLCRSSGSYFRLRQTHAWRYMRLYTRDSLSVVPILGLDLFQEVQR
jgi:hypothetical protein